MTLRRGFKSDANWYARVLRGELGLRPSDPLSPWELAKHLAITIVPLSNLRRYAPEQAQILMTRGRKWFSAVTIFTGRYGRSRLICNNGGNALTRQAADISHELAHALLGHTSKQIFQRDAVAEEEAQWMGPTLLVPEEAALSIARRRLSISEAARLFGVSESLVRMRLNVTAAFKRMPKRSA
jgi:Zn-dependent peptidase ImmA (M78 family)